MNLLPLGTTLAALLLSAAGCDRPNATPHDPCIDRAAQTLDSIYAHYAAPDTRLLRENYPMDADYRATYGASEQEKANPYAFLWPFSGTLSATAALWEATGDDHYREAVEQRVLPGLEEYFDTRREPAAYASYIRSAPQSDRFYDDNVWLGIDFTDLYALSGESRYLEQAQLIWRFIESGTDDRLGGGIYWCEQKKGSKNTCSNAPGAVLALKLHRATGDEKYLAQGRALYEWTRERLRDTTDNLYFDHVTLSGKIGRAKFPYNSGQMIQAAALLYRATGEEHFLREAQATAAGAARYFFRDHPDPEAPLRRIFARRDTWFTAVMLRGFIELYAIDGERKYLDLFRRNLDYAWDTLRDADGLFDTDFSGREHDRRHWLLAQAAMVEMYARLGALGLPAPAPETDAEETSGAASSAARTTNN